MCILLFKPMIVLKSPTGWQRKCCSVWMESSGIPTGACAVAAGNKIFFFKNFYPILAVLKSDLGKQDPWAGTPRVLHYVWVKGVWAGKRNLGSWCRWNSNEYIPRNTSEVGRSCWASFKREVFAVGCNQESIQLIQAFRLGSRTGGVRGCGTVVRLSGRFEGCWHCLLGVVFTSCEPGS